MASRLTHPTILPFYAFAGLYLATIHTHSFWWSSHPIILMILKIVPIWYLIAYVKVFNKPAGHNNANTNTAWDKRNATNGKPSYYSSSSSSSNSNSLSSTTTSPAGMERSYTNLISIALAVSSVGDVFMTQNAHTAFIAGGAVFGVAHILYVFAFRKRGTEAKYAYIISPLALVSLYSIASQVLSSYIMVLFVFLYNIMISATVISALCCHENNRKTSTLFAAIGASLFGISDYVIAFDLFVTSVPYSKMTIMVSYYTAQLLLALSVKN